jgi:hypothetical protein
MAAAGGKGAGTARAERTTGVGGLVPGYRRAAAARAAAALAA